MRPNFQKLYVFIVLPQNLYDPSAKIPEPVWLLCMEFQIFWKISELLKPTKIWREKKHLKTLSCKIVNIIPTKNNITGDKWKIWKGKHSGWSWPQTYKILTRSSLNAIWLTVLWQTDRHFKVSAICPNASI